MNHIIYADILFIVNTYINYALLRLCGIIRQEKIKTWKVVISAALGGLYSFVILIENFNSVLLLLSKLLFAALCVYIAFEAQSKRRYLKLYLTFIFLSFVFAGIMLAVWFFLSPDSMYYNNTVVYFDINALTLIVLTVICYFVVIIIEKCLKTKIPKSVIYITEIEIMGETFSCRALLDTGNCLKEPFSDLPVVVINSSVKNNNTTLKALTEKSEELCRYVVCKSLGTNTLLKAYRPKKLSIKGAFSDFSTDDVYIALTDEKIKQGEFELLLNNELFKG